MPEIIFYALMIPLAVLSWVSLIGAVVAVYRAVKDGR